jgi:hypothetical protein
MDPGNSTEPRMKWKRTSPGMGMAMKPGATRMDELFRSLQWPRGNPLYVSDNWKNNPGPHAG